MNDPAGRPPPQRFLGFWALLCLGALLGTAYVVLSGVGTEREAWQLLVERLRTFGRWPGSVVVLLLIYWAGSLCAMPGPLLLAVMVTCTGPLVGLCLCLAGTALSSSTAHLVSRWLGRAYLEATHPGVLARAQVLLATRPWLRVLQMRLIPILPFHVTNAVCGLAGVPIGPFALATMAGVLPRMLVYLYFVQALLAGLASPERIFYLNLAVSLTLLTLVTVVGVVLDRWLLRDSRSAP
ncbi:MAG: VTT domain-containing protein [Candidatus Riflebacteria bacterium]|nr:VTT domain-containing protein [Candidatus Riflebacteria bacterium]